MTSSATLWLANPLLSPVFFFQLASYSYMYSYMEKKQKQQQQLARDKALCCPRVCHCAGCHLMARIHAVHDAGTILLSYYPCS